MRMGLRVFNNYKLCTGRPRLGSHAVDFAALEVSKLAIELLELLWSESLLVCFCAREVVFEKRLIGNLQSETAAAQKFNVPVRNAQSKLFGAEVHFHQSRACRIGPNVLQKVLDVMARH